jgi:hypothetical protein
MWEIMRKLRGDSKRPAEVTKAVGIVRVKQDTWSMIELGSHTLILFVKSGRRSLSSAWTML